MGGGVPPDPPVNCSRHQDCACLGIPVPVLQSVAVLRYDVARQRCVDILGSDCKVTIYFCMYKIFNLT